MEWMDAADARNGCSELDAGSRCLMPDALNLLTNFLSLSPPVGLPSDELRKIGNLEEARTTHISPVSCLILYYIITTPSLYRLTEIASSTTYQEQGDIQNNMPGKCCQNFQDTFSRQPCGIMLDTLLYYNNPISL